MKKIIVILLIVIAYVMIALGMEYYVGNDIYLLIGKSVRFHYSNGNWVNDVDKQSYNKFQIYNINDYKKIGTHDIKYSNGWYAKVGGKYSLVDGVLMFKGKGNLNFLPYEVNGKLNPNEVKSILSKNGLPTKNYNGYYIEVDIDNDGKKEKIYSLRNYYNGMYIDSDIYYSLIVIVDEHDVTKIILDKSVKQLGWTNEISYIVDVDNDNKYEILVGKSDIELDNDNIKLEMYGLKDGKYVKLVGTE